MEHIIAYPLAALIYLIVVLLGFRIGGFVADRMRPVFGYIIPVSFIVISLRYNEIAKEHSLLFGSILVPMIGMLMSAGSKNNKYKTGEWPKAGPLPPTPVVAVPPPSPPPASQPQTVIHYTDKRDQSIRIDNSVKITVGDLNRDSARELLGLPAHFTGQRLENAYEDKIRILDAQAQALPRSDTKSRLLISQHEDRLEQAYEVLKRDKEA